MSGKKGKGGPPKGQGNKSGLAATILSKIGKPHSMVVSRNHNIYNKPKQRHNLPNQGNKIVGLIQANRNTTHEAKKKTPPIGLAIVPPGGFGPKKSGVVLGSKKNQMLK